MIRGLRKKMMLPARVSAFVIVLTFVISVGFAGCSNGSAPVGAGAGQYDAAELVSEREAEHDRSITGGFMIAAAASLQQAFEKELIPIFEEKYPAVKIAGTYDSSGKLRMQIENGLPSDIFFSADKRQMNALVAGCFIDGATVVDLLENRVVLVAGKDTETKVKGYENILDAKSIAIGDPDMVPAGRYAKEILEGLGVWEEVESRASYGMNSTEVFKWVAEGSAEVGVVYQSDCLALPGKVRMIAMDTLSGPDESQTQIIYPVGLRTGLGDKEAPRAFLEFLQGAEAQAVFGLYGFYQYAADTQV